MVFRRKIPSINIFIKQILHQVSVRDGKRYDFDGMTGNLLIF